MLTKLEADMTKLSQFKASTVVWQKKVVGHLVTYSIVLYLMLACLAYFKLFPAAQTRRDQVTSLCATPATSLTLWSPGAAAAALPRVPRPHLGAAPPPHLVVPQVTSLVQHLQL